MEASVRSNDCSTLLPCGRQRPLRRDGVAFCEVLKEEMPRARLCIAIRLETARHYVGRHQWRNPIIKCDLLTAGMQRISDAIGVTRLEDEGAWSAVGRHTVHQAHPDNSREDGIAGAFDRDIADVSLAKHAGSAECRGETLSLDRFWNRLRHRTLLNLAKLAFFGHLHS